MANNENKTDKKQQPRIQMSGLAALRKDLGVKKEEDQGAKQNPASNEALEPKESIIVKPNTPIETETEIKEPVLITKEEQDVSSPEVNTENQTVKEVPKVKPSNDLSKRQLVSFLQKRKNVSSKSETVNISTKHRDAIKQLANVASIGGIDGRIGTNDILENVIEWFIESYFEEITKKPGMKEILKHLGYK